MIRKKLLIIYTVVTVLLLILSFIYLADFGFSEAQKLNENQKNRSFLSYFYKETLADEQEQTEDMVEVVMPDLDVTINDAFSNTDEYGFFEPSISYKDVEEQVEPESKVVEIIETPVETEVKVEKKDKEYVGPSAFVTTEKPYIKEGYTVYFTESDIEMLARLMWLEAGGIASDTEKACVAWTALNILDSPLYKGNTIEEVVTYPGRFYYKKSAKVYDDLYALAEDVLIRWNNEKNGETDVGRVLPNNYFYFAGDGKHNYFRDAYRGGNIWDYSLPSPYED